MRDKVTNASLTELSKIEKSIFNPARLKIKAMQSEMPKKYWKNLPAARLIEELIAQSQTRTLEMLATKQRPVKAALRNAYLRSLRGMNEACEGQSDIKTD